MATSAAPMAQSCSRRVKGRSAGAQHETVLARQLRFNP